MTYNKFFALLQMLTGGGFWHGMYTEIPPVVENSANGGMFFAIKKQQNGITNKERCCG